MSLHLSKLAYGCTALPELVAAVDRRAVDGRVNMTTRYLPKRHAEILGGGSLYWIIKHQIVARAPILAFEPSSDGRIDIMLKASVIPVRPAPRRAHQGWRYLESSDAPGDLLGDDGDTSALPAALAIELAELSLV
jgi:hypothetical protein